MLKTKDGVALSESDCYPNGYFFIPADDSGKYVTMTTCTFQRLQQYFKITGDFQEGLDLELAVRGPKGWTVEPKSVSVRYSRQGLKGCEKDVVFSFTGFEVTVWHWGTIKSCV